MKWRGLQKQHPVKRQPCLQPGEMHSARARWVYLGLGFCFFILALRAIVIQMFPAQSHSLQRIARAQYQRSLVLSSVRGKILDHQGEVFALSIKKPSLFVNPRVFSPTPYQAQLLSRYLGLSTQSLHKMAAKKSYFAWLKRQINRQTAEKIAKLNIKGLHQVDEPARFYPGHQLASQLIGLVGVDNKGLFGLERVYNDELSGEPRLLVESKDARGQAIFLEAKSAAPLKQGHELYLTLDWALQSIAHEALQKGMHNAKARAGFAIVADPHTGKILALANAPFLNLNNPRLRPHDERIKNRALLDAYEPGSIVKPLVAASALERGLSSETKEYEVGEGVLRIGRRVIHDVHKPNTPFLNLQDIIVHSSNVGIFKVATQLKPEGLYTAFKKFGLGQRLWTTGFPAESQGWLSDYAQWKDIRFANIAFGQGLMVSALQMVQAYGAIANGGNLMAPYFIDKIVSPTGELVKSYRPYRVAKVLSASVAQRMRNILKEVVKQSATRAQTPSFEVGGKTGTSQKVDPITRSYSHEKHISQFIGIAPIKDPHLVIYVVLDEPQQKYSYGALWAAPVFAEIAEKSLQYLNVAPDRKTSYASKGEIIRRESTF